MPVSTNVECRANGDKDTRNRSLPHHPHREPYLQPVSDGRPWSADRLNMLLDRLQLPHEANEPLIEGLLEMVEHCAPDSRIEYRLLTARVLEAALLCAGHYVDNCEFTAAGDLLANPRRILVHIRNCRLPIVKRRHGRLSEQLAAFCGTQPFPEWFRDHAILEIAKPALVPFLFQRLERFQCFRPSYLDSIRRRMGKAADAIGFLSAWGIKGWEDMQRRIRRASPRERGFISANLCRFNLVDYQALGREIDRMLHEAGATSEYLATRWI
jgi:hypothetical protein